MTKLGLGRRRFLRMTSSASLGLTGFLGHGCAPAGRGELPTRPEPALGAGAADGPAIFVPKVNGGINVQPVRRLDRDPNTDGPLIVPELVALQLQKAYELGFDGIRISAPGGDRANFLAAVPYVRAARALGIDAVVVLANFEGVTTARALWDPEQRPDVLRLYHQVFATPPAPAAPGAGGLGPQGVGRVAFQILNEPALFSGVPPDVYVREILRPCADELRALDAQLIVVGAAEVGTVDGPPRMWAMIEAGLEGACDRVAYHVYDRDVIALLAPNVTRLVWVTESGVAGTSRHLAWVKETFEEIRSVIGDVSRIFYYDLYDHEPGKFRLIDLQHAGANYRSVVESVDLVAHFSQNVRVAAGGQPLLAFDTLVADVRAYFPTAADVEAYDQVFES